MEKISVKDLSKKSQKELQTLFVSKDYFFDAERDSKVYRIKTITPNPAKADAIKRRDEYASYVQDFDFVATDIDTNEDIFLDGHAGIEYFITKEPILMIEFNKLRADRKYEEEWIYFVKRLKRDIRFPKIEVVGERSKKAKEKLEELQKIINGIS